jgi:hypothetical protein
MSWGADQRKGFGETASTIRTAQLGIANQTGITTLDPEPGHGVQRRFEALL